MTLRHLDLGDCQRLAEDFVRPYHDDYLAMYSSVQGGLVTYSLLMTGKVRAFRPGGVPETPSRPRANHRSNLRDYTNCRNPGLFDPAFRLPWPGRLYNQSLRVPIFAALYCSLPAQCAP